MDDKQLEERLHLLKESYERTPAEIDINKIIDKLDEVPYEKTSKGTKWQRVTVWAVSIASVFIITILGASFLYEENNITTDEKEYTQQNIEKLVKSYTAERQKRQKKLEMSEEAFSSLGFVRYADTIFSAQISPGTLEGKNDNLSIEEAYEKAIEGLKLPSEMVEDVKKKGKLSAQESIIFVDDFIAKTEYLIEYYDFQLWEHKEVLQKATVNDRPSAHVLISKKNEMPEDIQTLIKILPEQGLKVAINNEENGFLIRPAWNIFYGDIKDALTEHEFSYLALYSDMPGYDGLTTLLREQPVSSLSSYLSTMEKTLLSTDDSSAIHHRFENYYFELTEHLLFPEDLSEVFNENNEVQPYARTVWESLANLSGISPLGTFFKPLVTSMEANGWKYNATYKELNMEQLRSYYIQALDGELDIKKLDWESILPQSLISNLPDAIDHNGFGELYDKFNEDFDPLVLHGIDPLLITLLYEYASIQNNHEMMWNLISEAAILSWNKEAFLEEPTVRISIPQSADSMYYHSFQTKKEKGILTTTLGTEIDGKIEFYIPFRLDSDDIWRLNISKYVSVDETKEPEVDVNDDFIQRVHDLYKQFAEKYDQKVLKDATASEIVGLYYYTEQLEDFETQYELYIKGDKHLTISKEEFLSAEHPTPIEVTKLFTHIRFEEREVTNSKEDRSGVAYLTVHPDQLEGERDFMLGFQLIHTENGWRAAFMPTQ